MSETLTCERGSDVEQFLSRLASESAEIVAQKIPAEYREAYLGSYAAGLLLTINRKDQQYV